MIYRKQSGFDRFRCIADKCPKSCCIGWQIMIDEDSLEKYKNVDGSFSDRLRSAVDYKAQAFRQHHTRCMMLNENGLCDLQSTLGEEYLCDTCRLYPRHIEEFQDLREYSLSLSCPEVTRMIMEPNYEFAFAESEDDVLDDPEDFDDFDFFLFDQLEFAKDKMLTLASDRSLPLSERMRRIAAAAFRLQELYDEGNLLAMGDVAFDALVSSSSATSDSGKDLASTIYLYSREVEHSDPNINTLISYFEEELA